MLSEYREMGTYNIRVKWGDETGELQLQLWGAMPEGPKPMEYDHDPKTLVPSHVLGGLYIETEDYWESFRVYRKDCAGWDRLWNENNEAIEEPWLAMVSDMLSQRLDDHRLEAGDE